jgi:hypothetical protein
MRAAPAPTRSTTKRTRNKRGVYTKAERDQMFRADQRDKLAKLRARVKGARVDKRAALKAISEACKATRQDVQTRCRLEREEARAAGWNVINERQAALDEERRQQKQMRHWSRKEKQTRAKAKARKAESDETVARNIDPEFLPVWEKMKGKIKKGSHSSRTEAFEQWMHDHPAEVLEISAAAAEDISDWLQEEESYYRMANPITRLTKAEQKVLSYLQSAEHRLKGTIHSGQMVYNAVERKHPEFALVVGGALAMLVRRGLVKETRRGKRREYQLTPEGAAWPHKVKPSPKPSRAKAPQRRAPEQLSLLERNPSGPTHRIPARTVKLGEPLDLWVQKGDQVTHYGSRDLKGFVMLVGVGAEQAAPGRTRLYLVLPRKIKADGRSFGAGAATFRAWHQRNPDAVIEYTGLPDAMGAKLGRAVRVDYRSDKWGGRNIEYTHDFYEGRPPLVYADRADRPRGFCLVGGDMRITKHGIE